MQAAWQPDGECNVCDGLDASDLSKKPIICKALLLGLVQTGVGGSFPMISSLSHICSGSPKPHPSKPHPCNMPQAITEVALQLGSGRAPNSTETQKELK